MHGPVLRQPFCRCDHGSVEAAADAALAQQYMVVAWLSLPFPVNEIGLLILHTYMHLRGYMLQESFYTCSYLHAVC